MVYKCNCHVLYFCKDRVVFCPKYRRKVLVNGEDKRLKEIIDQVAKELGLDGEVQWILRMGYLESYPAPVSLRMPVSWFIQA